MLISGLIFLLFAVLSCSIALHAQCKLLQDEDDTGQEFFILENKYLQVKILPQSSGRISEFMLKKGQRHCFPKLDYQTMSLTEGVFVVARSNFAGFEDWIFEEGLLKQYVAYTAKVIADTPEKCSLSVSCRKGSGLLSRIMTLRADSAVLEIETVITGVKSDVKANRTVSFWSHIMVDLDRAHDREAVRLYLPVKKSDGNMQRRKESVIQRVPFDCIVSRYAIAVPEALSDMFRPAQPWRAYCRKGLLLGSTVPLADLAPDGFFYNFIGLENAPDLSLETVYGARPLPPGTKRVHHQTLLAREWSHPVDYLDQNVVVCCKWNGKRNAVLTIGGTSSLSGVTADAELLDNGKAVEKITFAPGNLTPENEFVQKLAFRREVTAPRLRLTFRDSSGKVVTTADLLKRMNFPLK